MNFVNKILQIEKYIYDLVFKTYEIVDKYETTFAELFKELKKQALPGYIRNNGPLDLELRFLHNKLSQYSKKVNRRKKLRLRLVS